MKDVATFREVRPEGFLETSSVQTERHRQTCTQLEAALGSHFEGPHSTGAGGDADGKRGMPLTDDPGALGVVALGICDGGKALTQGTSLSGIAGHPGTAG